MTSDKINSFVLYGAGCKAEEYLKFLKYQGLNEHIECFCTSFNSGEKRIDDLDVLQYGEIKDKRPIFLIAVEKDTQAYKEIEDVLIKDGQKYYGSLQDLEMDLGISNYVSDLVAFMHISAEYYDVADNVDNLRLFWGNDTIFKRMFQKLDLRNVVELACGHGRHVPQYIDSVGEITLVDVLKENIEFCKKRFAESPNVQAIQNNGHDMQSLGNGEYSALFTYDAMVHFEMMDIASYLKETYRILEPGGMALFHHSNNDASYKNTYSNSPHYRNFMSRKLFAYLAFSAGFNIVEQQIFDWGNVVDLDCLTLVKKPKK